MHAYLYDVAAGQHGFFTSAQAQECGFSGALLAYHAQQGKFERRAHGLYRLVRFPISPEDDLAEALLYVGRGAVLSHESALALYGAGNVTPSETHVTILRGLSAPRVIPSSIRVHHRNKPYASGEILTRRGLAVVRPDIALIEAATTISDPSLLEDAARELARNGWAIKAAIEHVRPKPIKKKLQELNL